MGRYARTPVIDFGTQYGTSYAISAIRKNIANGNIRFDEIQLQENQRLDTLAGKYYGDGRLFWILAASSNVGWSLQVPAGTRILVPNLTDCFRFTG